MHQRYQQGKIYKIVNDVDDNIYVGSTCKSRLCQRWTQHKSDFLKFIKGSRQGMKIYQHINQLGVQHFKIELIENHPCHTRDELRAREGYWQKHLKSSLNVNIAGRTFQEYYQDKNDMYKANNQHNCETNIMCICGKKTSLTHKARHEMSKSHQLYIQFGGLNIIEL